MLPVLLKQPSRPADMLPVLLKQPSRTAEMLSALLKLLSGTVKQPILKTVERPIIFMKKGKKLFLPFMTVSPLLAVFGFLHGRAAAVRAGDVFLFLGLRLHFVVGFTRCAAPAETDAILENGHEIVFHIFAGIR